MTGSPPHTRGIHETTPHLTAVVRFTPAYAGNTSRHTKQKTRRRVHPRIRGEYPTRAMSRTGSSGSPPHTRGILGLLTLKSHLFRFTPAYAGNTLISDPLLADIQVHPRIRGEYLSVFHTESCNMGSPPHTRGIHHRLQPRSAAPGFTPAYAGNTKIPKIFFLVRKVHPRIRGEYLR